MPWGIAVAAVVGAYGANEQAKAGEKAAGAQSDANAAAIAEQRRQYDQTRTDMLPFLEAGYGAINRQNAFLNGDWSGFENSPDYAFAVDQGFKGLNRGAAANGSFGSGGADADRIALGQGLATQYASNYWNKLAGMAGQGQSGVNTLGGLGANQANQIGGYLQDTGNARASSYANRANAWGNYANQLSGLAGQYMSYNGFGGI